MARISNIAEPGALFKAAPPMRDPAYLAAIRVLPCLVCRAAPCDAAHVRIGNNAGIGQKPSDRRALPLCHRHHMQQHECGERTFWHHRLGLDPDALIAALNAAYPDIDAMRVFVLRS